MLPAPETADQEPIPAEIDLAWPIGPKHRMCIRKSEKTLTEMVLEDRASALDIAWRGGLVASPLSGEVAQHLSLRGEGPSETILIRRSSWLRKA